MVKRKLKKFQVKLSIKDAVHILRRLSEDEDTGWEELEAVEVYFEDIISKEDLAKIIGDGKLLMIEPTNQDIFLAIANLLENQ